MGKLPYTGVLCALLLSVVLTGCQKQPAGGERPEASLGDGSAAVTPSEYGATFLGTAECSSRAQGEFREVSCTSEKAAARVLARHDGSRKTGPACPSATDFVLHISESAPVVENGPGAVGVPVTVPTGYACMRNLEAPHPGDPGMGGGPLTVVGDCVYSSRKGQVKETACDGSAEYAPGFRVERAVAARAECPHSTALYVQLGGEKPVGCARRV
ncbi:hypothetical protein [Streptomyces sp. NPDC051219]|uniref:hypothetical protein n=1 Tax=Streptomyces sp. NPDC051219 TaxID=3155283 RepID=UPI003443D404